MPNYVYNRMKVYGKETELNKFRDAVKSDKSDFSFQAILPEPEDTSEWKKDLIPGRYIWKNVNWNTQWDASDAILTIENDHLFYEFITTWSCPYNIYFTLIETYTELNFRIDWSGSVNDWTCNLNAEKGEYKEFTYENLVDVDIDDDHYRQVLCLQDFLKNTKCITKGEILRKTKSLNTDVVKVDSEIDKKESDENNEDDFPPWETHV